MESLGTAGNGCAVGVTLYMYEYQLAGSPSYES